MPNKTEKQKLITRALAGFTPKSVDDDKRTIRGIATSEKAAYVMDWSRGEAIEEILLMSGAELPKKQRVPLLDSHNSGTVKAILGSAGDFAETEVDGYKSLECELTFSRTADGYDAFCKSKEGHLDSVSIGYMPIAATWIKAGETAKVQGKVYEGGQRGLQVTTKFAIHELSLCAVPADDLAKMRSIETTEQETINNEKPLETPVTEITAIVAETNIETVENRKDVKQMPINEINEALATERNRVKSIREACKIANLENMVDTLVDNGNTIEQAREAIFAEMAKGSKPISAPSITIVADEQDKVRAAVSDGFALRMGVKLDNAAPGADEFRGMGIFRTAEELLRRQGVNTRAMSRPEIAKRALVSSDLANALGSASNKLVKVAFMRAPATYEAWVEKRTVNDVKQITTVTMGELSTLGTIGEDGVVTHGSVTESADVYTPTMLSKLITLTEKMLLNDDSTAIEKAINNWGMVARAQANASAYGILTANAALADTGLLFNNVAVSTPGGHANLGTGALTAATLSASKAAFLKQKSPTNGLPLNIPARFLIVPAALEGNALVLINSVQTNSTEGDFNPHKNTLIPVVDATLDANSTTAYYLAADPNYSLGSVEFATVAGYETPRIESDVLMNYLGITYRITWAYGIGATGFRGLYKSTGA